jgi:predicted dehydrogenase
MLAEGPETTLAGVWARRPEAALELASAHGVPELDDFDALLERCDAMAFAVPPDVQVELAIRAARAGRHLMLDKPLALTLDDARRLSGEIERAGVVSQLMLTQRFRPAAQRFLGAARGMTALGARLAFLSSAFVRGPYATGWRREQGALHDLGPHAFDLLDAALGPILRVTGTGDPRRWVSLLCEHAGGAVSDVALSGIVEMPQSVFRIEVYGEAGVVEFDGVAAAHEPPWPAARRAFAASVRSGRAGELDVRRGLALQEVIERALSALG